MTAKRCRCGKRHWWTNDRARLEGWVRFWGEWVCDYCVADALHRVRGDKPGLLGGMEEGRMSPTKARSLAERLDAVVYMGDDYTETLEAAHEAAAALRALADRVDELEGALHPTVRAFEFETFDQAKAAIEAPLIAERDSARELYLEAEGRAAQEFSATLTLQHKLQAAEERAARLQARIVELEVEVTELRISRGELFTRLSATDGGVAERTEGGREP